MSVPTPFTVLQAARAMAAPATERTMAAERRRAMEEMFFMMEI
jgi:hypothetical protein